MKNMIRMVAVLCLTALLVAAFGGCSASGVSIDFGEKYTSGETFYVFESDGTGYREIHDSDEGMISVRETFLWRETSDGAVLLFSLDIEYLDDHTSAASFSSLIEKPIYFADDFFYYTYSNQYGTSRVVYFKEGSALYEDLKEQS